MMRLQVIRLQYVYFRLRVPLNPLNGFAAGAEDVTVHGCSGAGVSGSGSTSGATEVSMGVKMGSLGVSGVKAPQDAATTSVGVMVPDT